MSRAQAAPSRRRVALTHAPPRSRRHGVPTAALSSNAAGHRALAAAELASVALVLALLAWIALGPAMAPRAAQRVASAPVHVASGRAIDPRLIVRPGTVTQVAEVDGLRLALIVHPALPGPNRLVMTLVDRGRALAGARVHVTATMLDMPMRPAQLEARAAGGGRYVGTAPLSMLGRWQLTVRVERPHAAPLVHVFAVPLDLPAALLQAVAAARDHAGQ